MRLSVELSECGECSEQKCLENCPNQLGLNSLECRHCNPREAKCALACPREAFVEIAEGILSIDESKCDGCGKCVEECEFNAITMRNGKAAKCDLCEKNNFFIACIESCDQSAIKAVKSRKEVREAEKALGWRIFELKKGIKKQLIEKEQFRIVECRNGEKWYLIKEFPELSRQEATLLEMILDEFQSNPANEKKSIPETMESILELQRIELDERQKEYFLGILFLEVNGFGPLSVLLEDSSLEEITLIGTGKGHPLRVYHRLFGWCKCNVYFYSQKNVVNTVNRMLLKTDRRLSLNNPRVNGILPDGSRLNATIPPISFNQPSFTIRKFNSKKFTPFELVKNNTFSAELMAFLSLALETDCSMLIAGNTGSGKTTTLNALFSFVPETERIILIEETPELQIPHKHRVKLNTCPQKGIEMSELIVDSLRMRPDRIIVGEIRSREEVRAFIDTLLAGQGKGSYATFHSVSSEEALKRLELLGVKKIDLCSLDLLVVQKRWDKIDLKKGKRRELRRVIEAVEVIEKNSKPKVNSLYQYNYDKNRIEKKNKSKKAREKIKRAFSFTKKKFKRELLKRKKFIQGKK